MHVLYIVPRIARFCTYFLNNILEEAYLNPTPLFHLYCPRVCFNKFLHSLKCTWGILFYIMPYTFSSKTKQKTNKQTNKQTTAQTNPPSEILDPPLVSNLTGLTLFEKLKGMNKVKLDKYSKSVICLSDLYKAT